MMVGSFKRCLMWPNFGYARPIRANFSRKRARRFVQTVNIDAEHRSTAECDVSWARRAIVTIRNTQLYAEGPDWPFTTSVSTTICRFLCNPAFHMLSTHRFIEQSGEQCKLLVLIDDVTSKLMHLRFVLRESIFSYFEAVRGILRPTTALLPSTRTSAPSSG